MSNFLQFLKKKQDLITVKLLLTVILMFFVLLNLNIVRIIKDSLIVTLISAEITSFIKLWIEMPIGAIFIIIYTKLNNTFSTEAIFQFIVAVFIVFFSIFIFVVLPKKELLQFDIQQIKSLTNTYPYLKFFIIMYTKWVCVLFYVICSLWPVILYSLLFWQLMNKLTTISEAINIYPTINFIGQLSLLISGSIITFFSNYDQPLFKLLLKFFSNRDTAILNSLSLLVIFTGIIILISLFFIRKYTFSLSNSVIKKREKINLGIRNSFKIILKSSALGYIMVIVASYSITINLIEGIWLAKSKELYTEANQLMNYQGKVLFWTGIFTLISTISSKFILKSKGWFYSALITPVISLIVGGVFFLVIYLDKILLGSLSYYTFIAPILVIVILGALQNILIKGVKYSYFDITKEMAYLPLEEELKTNGKAAVEVLGARVGKFISVLFQCSLFTFFPNNVYSDIVLPLMIFFLFSCLLWIISIVKLNTFFCKYLP
jgi:AAA family ATP:ADP antiporter